jgi:hypothetical protein
MIIFDKFIEDETVSPHPPVTAEIFFGAGVIPGINTRPLFD